MNINLNISNNHLSYAYQQSVDDERSIGKTIESALGLYQLYRTGMIALVHLNETQKRSEEGEKTGETVYWTTEAKTGNLIQERESSD